MRFNGRHGILPREKKTGGPFRVDLEVQIHEPPVFKDRLRDTIDYRGVYAVTRRFLEKRRFNTLEALADRLAGEILKLPRAERVRVRITKLVTPLGAGMTAAAEVERSLGKEGR